MKAKIFSVSVVLLVWLLSACNLPLSAASTPSTVPPTPQPSATVEIVSPTPPASSATEAPLPTQVEPTLKPTSPPASPAGPYAVILVEEGDTLNIRSAAGAGNTVVGHFPPGANNVTATGQRANAGGDLWLEVNNPAGGTGWVNGFYLTEAVSGDVFCADPRVPALLEDFRRALNEQDGDLLASLVSPVHGLELYYWRYGPSANYTPEEASWVFQSTYDVNWGAGPSGMDDVGTFSEYPLPALLEVVNAPDYELQCNNASTASMYLEPWPLIYKPVNFYALHKPATPGVDLDWKTWLAGVEFIQGKPTLMVLIYFQWEP